MLEFSRRELWARFYLAEKLLASRRDRVIIFRHLDIFWLALFGRPGIVYLKSFPRQYAIALRLLKLRGFCVVAWNEESIWLSTENNRYRIVLSPEVSRFIDGYFAINSTDASIAKEQGVRNESIFVVGNVRFEMADLLCQEKSKRNSIQKPEIRRILLVGNSDLIDNLPLYQKTARMPVDVLKSIESHNEDVVEAIEKAKKDKKIFEEFIDIVNRKYSNFYQVCHREYLKPSGIYRENQNFCNALSILEAIKYSDIVISYGSTVSIEALIAMRESFILTGAGLQQLDSRLRKSVPIFQETSALLYALENSRLNGSAEEIKRQKDMAMNQFGLEEGLPTAALIANLAMNLRSKMQHAPSDIAEFSKFTSRLKCAVYLLKLWGSQVLKGNDSNKSEKFRMQFLTQEYGKMQEVVFGSREVYSRHNVRFKLTPFRNRFLMSYCK